MAQTKEQKEAAKAARLAAAAKKKEESGSEEHEVDGEPAEYLVAPEGCGKHCSVEGHEYEVEDGFVLVKVKHIAALVDHGFKPHVEE